MKPNDITTIQERARQHQEELDIATRWHTPQTLAARWSVSVSTVKAIPWSELPYKEFGRGIKHKWRRYSPEAVAAYEASAIPKAAA